MTAALLLRAWWKAGLGLLIGAVLVYPLAHWAGHRDGVRAEKVAEAQRLEKLKARNAAAVVKSDARRTEDQRATSKLEMDLRASDDKAPDTRPSDARLALACERLRKQNPRLADAAECRGLAGRTQAGARP